VGVLHATDPMSAPAPADVASPFCAEPETFPDLKDLTSIPLNGKSALISGITGQDGSYLAELLLSKVRLAALCGQRNCHVVFVCFLVLDRLGLHGYGVKTVR
jgi:hypothetical protein